MCEEVSGVAVKLCGGHRFFLREQIQKYLQPPREGLNREASEEAIDAMQ